MKAPVAEASSGHYLYLTLYSMSKLTNFHRNGWNLNVLPHLPGSVLKHLGFVQGESNFETESCYLTAIKSTLPQSYTRFCGLQFVCLFVKALHNLLYDPPHQPISNASIRIKEMPFKQGLQ